MNKKLTEKLLENGYTVITDDSAQYTHYSLIATSDLIRNPLDFGNEQDLPLLNDECAWADMHKSSIHRDDAYAKVAGIIIKHFLINAKEYAEGALIRKNYNLLSRVDQIATDKAAKLTEFE